MSRVAKAIVPLPQGVQATVAPDSVTVKGAKGTLSLPLAEGIRIVQQDKSLSVDFGGTDSLRMAAGSTRAHLANMVTGVRYSGEKITLKEGKKK